MSADGWIPAAELMPADGQEVTVMTNHGQVRQIVRDARYSGGWKQVNCQGWECVSFDPTYVTHWRADIVARPKMTGPKDAPWMPGAAAGDRSDG